MQGQQEPKEGAQGAGAACAWIIHPFIHTWLMMSWPAVQGQQETQEGARVQALHVVQQSTPLTHAFQLLLDTGVSALPVVNEVRI